MAIFSRQKSKKEKTEKPVAKPESKSAASMKDLYTAEATSTSPKQQVQQQKSLTSRAYRVLLKPLVTEKATMLGAENKYVFAVDTRANKIEIAKAIKDIYGIKPTAVNLIRMEGKLTLSGRTRGQRKDWKKAVVTLPAGKTIQVYEGV